MVVVKKKKGESEDRLISRFRKKVISEGILIEVREKERYEKPSAKKQKEKKRIKFAIELEKKRNQ
jgi:small subunit ribosomal protein S21